jgi:hypothetical protein
VPELIFSGRISFLKLELTRRNSGGRHTHLAGVELPNLRVGRQQTKSAVPVQVAISYFNGGFIGDKRRR